MTEPKTVPGTTIVPAFHCTFRRAAVGSIFVVVALVGGVEVAGASGVVEEGVGRGVLGTGVTWVAGAIFFCQATNPITPMRRPIKRLMTTKRIVEVPLACGGSTMGFADEGTEEGWSIWTVWYHSLGIAVRWVRAQFSHTTRSVLRVVKT